MGILNATPDSFYHVSRTTCIHDALHRALAMCDDGADIIDVGGESTRPGSEAVDSQEEKKRVIPIIKAIREHSDVCISIDTRKADVAEAALNAGANMVNDVSALSFDPDMLTLVADRRVPVILMHMRGLPQTMQDSPEYSNTVQEVCSEIRERIDRALSAGIGKDQIIIDPGIGFAKRLEDNLSLIKNLRSLQELGYPILIGLSRKSFLSALEGVERTAEERLAGSLAGYAFCSLNGVRYLRVHDVRETVDMFRVFNCIEMSK